MLKNTRINHKLALFVAVPILGLLYFAIANTLEKLETVNEIKSLEILAEFAVQSGLLVHELQKERGMATGFISSQGNKFLLELEQQIVKTDNFSQGLNTFLLDFPNNHSDAQAKLKTAIGRLENIEIKRNLIKDLNMSLTEQLHYYTNIIDSLLLTIDHLLKVIANNTLSNEVMAYVNFLQVKEKAGLERATLIVILNNDSLEIYEQFVALVKIQDIYLQNFIFFATPSQKQFYKQTMQGQFVEEVKRIRAIVNNKSASIASKQIGKHFGIEPNYWWEMATGKINLLKEVENKISADLKASVIALKQEVQTMFTSYLIIIGGIILFSFFYARIIFRETNLAYARFVPREFLKLLNKKDILDFKLGNNVEMTMTVLFSDIRSFTALSEKMSPQTNFDFINAYFGEIGPIIYKNNGIVDKYIGDAVMALFVNADDALNAAITMRRVQKYQGIEAGIGINTGKLMLGIIGEQNRMQCTVISDTVNVAARLESVTKIYKVPLLISQSTLDSLKLASQHAFRFLDNVKVKGRSGQIKIYEVLDSEATEIKKNKLATIDIFERAVALFQKNKFTEVQKLMQECLRVNPFDATAELYLRRCQNFLNINENSEMWEELSSKSEWNSDLLVYNQIIDEQHKELFVRMKNLLMAMGSNQPEDEINEMISFLKNYVITHFSVEERYMKQYHYPDYAIHKAKHAEFRNNLENIIKHYNTSGYSLELTLQVKEKIVEWFIHHIMKMDKRLGAFINDKQVKSE